LSTGQEVDHGAPKQAYTATVWQLAELGVNMMARGCPDMLASSSSNSSFLAIEKFKVSCCWFVALNERALLQYAEATPRMFNKT